MTNLRPQMERRERLRTMLSAMEEEKVLAAMDAVEPEDAAREQFVPSTTFYTEGPQALLDVRVAVRTLLSSACRPWLDDVAKDGKSELASHSGLGHPLLQNAVDFQVAAAGYGCHPAWLACLGACNAQSGGSWAL